MDYILVFAAAREGFHMTWSIQIEQIHHKACLPGNLDSPLVLAQSFNRLSPSNALLVVAHAHYRCIAWGVMG